MKQATNDDEGNENDDENEAIREGVQVILSIYEKEYELKNTPETPSTPSDSEKKFGLKKLFGKKKDVSSVFPLQRRIDDSFHSQESCSFFYLHFYCWLFILYNNLALYGFAAFLHFTRVL